MRSLPHKHMHKHTHPTPPPTLPLADIHTHTDTLTVINHLHMCTHLIVPPECWWTKNSNRLCRGRTIQTAWVGCFCDKRSSKASPVWMEPFTTISHGRGMTGWRQVSQCGHGNAQWRKQGDGWNSHVSILFTGVGQRKAGSLGIPPAREGNCKKQLLYSKCMNQRPPTLEIFWAAMMFAMVVIP